MVDSFKVINFNQNILALESAKTAEELYQKEYADGQLCDAQGFGWLKANCLRILYSIVDLTFRTQLVKGLENDKYDRIFKECTAFLADPESPVRIDPTKVKLTPDEQTTVDKVKNEWSAYLISSLISQLPKELLFLKDDYTVLEGPKADQLATLKPNFVYRCLEAHSALAKVYNDLQTAKDKNQLALPSESRALTKLELLNELIGMPKIKSYLDNVVTIQESVKNPDAYLANYKALHTEFVADGTHVEIVDGQLLPTKEQLKKAFKLVLEKHFPDLPPPTTPAGGAFLARLVQYVMCGDQLKMIPQPESDICFTCKEISQLNETLPIKEQGSAFVWYLKNSKNYETLIKAGKTEKESLLEQVRFFLTQFWKDADRLLPTAVGNKAAVNPRVPENFTKMCEAIREDFFKSLVKDPENGIKQMTESMQKFCQTVNIPPNFDFKEWCEAALPKDRDLKPLLNMMIKQTHFNDSQFKDLKSLYIKQFGQVDQILVKLNTLLRLHFLKFMILNQQGSTIIQPLHIEAYRTLIMPQTRVANALKVDHLAQYPTPLSKTEYHFKADEFRAWQECRVGVMQEEAQKQLNIKNVRADAFYFMQWTREYAVSFNLEAKSGSAHSSLTNYKQVLVSPHSHPFLDTLIASLKPGS